MLGAATIGAGALALSGEDDDADPPTSAELAQQRAAEVAKLLSDKTSNADAGIVVRYPVDWRGAKRGPLINLQAPDRCIAVSLSAPAPAAQARPLYDGSLAAIGREFGKVDTRPLGKLTIDGLPTRGSLTAVRTKQGNAVVIRMSVAEGKRNAYLVQTVYRSPPCAESAPTADLIVENLELSK